MKMVCSSCHFLIWNVTVMSFSKRRIFKKSGKRLWPTPVSMLTFWLDIVTTRISGQRRTRRTIVIVRHGTRKPRTSSWPTIRSRHKHIGLHQGPMKRNTKRFQVRTCVWFLHVQIDCNLTILFLQLWYSQQAVEGNAPGHPLGFDGYGQFGPIKVVGGRGEGDHLPNINGLRWVMVMRKTRI